MQSSVLGSKVDDKLLVHTYLRVIIEGLVSTKSTKTKEMIEKK